MPFLPFLSSRGAEWDERNNQLRIQRPCQGQRWQVGTIGFRCQILELQGSQYRSIVELY